MFWNRDLPADAMDDAYRLILARRMSSEDLSGLDANCRRSLTALYQHLLFSDEFRKRVAPRQNTKLLDAVSRHYLTEQDVETEVEDAAVLGRLMDRTIGQWQAHGTTDPVWSITTNDEYRAETLTAEKLEQFYASGAHAISIIDGFAKRSGHRLRCGVCLELGAGVGRCTEHLARIFDRVIAVEISEGILDVCRKRMAEKKIDNVEMRLLNRPDDLESFAPYDFFFSTAVLQHNTPPMQRILLDYALDGLARRGHCLFQTPDQLHEYAFSAKRYLDSSVSPHDMHCFPRPRVIELLNSRGMTILDVVADTFSPEFGSYTYLAQKAP